MAPTSDSDEFELPERTVGARVVGFIERACVVGVRASRPMMIVVVGVFLAYTLGGFVLVQLGVWSPSYPFLSVTADVYFGWLGFLSGFRVCVGTGSLIGLAFLENGEGPVHNELSILASCIGFGFGAGVIRMTYPTVLVSIL